MDEGDLAFAEALGVEPDFIAVDETPSFPVCEFVPGRLKEPCPPVGPLPRWGCVLFFENLQDIFKLTSSIIRDVSCFSENIL
jgi:hypothetical protein